MANVRRLGLTRDQLAKFLDEHEQIRQFELLFTAVDELQTTGIDSTTYDAGAALAGVNKLAGVVAQLAQDGAIDASTGMNSAAAGESFAATIHREREATLHPRGEGACRAIARVGEAHTRETCVEVFGHAKQPGPRREVVAGGQVVP